MQSPSHLIRLVLIVGSLMMATGCEKKPVAPKSQPIVDKPFEPPRPEPTRAEMIPPADKGLPPAAQAPARKIHVATFDGETGFIQTGMKQYFGDKMVSVNANESYTLSVDAVASGPSAEQARHYLGIACFDVDGNGISTYHVAKYPGSTDTTLAANLKTGDTKIVLTDATGWNNLGTMHRCSLAWYGYATAAGVPYPDYSYTRFFVADLWVAGAITNNFITLSKPWSGAELPAGKPVRNAESGGTYNYALLGGRSVPSTLTNYTATVAGEWTNGIYSDIRFRPGTAFIKPLILANWTGTLTNTTLSVSNFTITSAKQP